MATEVGTAEPSAPPKERHGLELIGVLGVTYAASGVGSLLENIRDQLVINRGLGLKHVATGPIVYVPKPTYPWFDLTADVIDVLLGLMPAFLAVVLLLRTPGGPGFGIGLDRIRRIEIPAGARVRRADRHPRARPRLHRAQARGQRADRRHQLPGRLVPDPGAAAQRPPGRRRRRGGRLRLRAGAVDPARLGRAVGAAGQRRAARLVPPLPGLRRVRSATRSWA